MGNKGSTSLKARYSDSLVFFTRWGLSELRQLFYRGTRELGNSFALRKFEYDFLLGTEMVSFLVGRELWQTIFDPEGKGVVDKFEIMCLICLISSLSNQEKVEYLFDLFNFNDKGYLLESELALLLVSSVNGALRADKLIARISVQTIHLLVKYAICKYSPDSEPKSIRKPQLVKFAAETKDVRAFLDTWRSQSGKVLLSANEMWRDTNFPANEIAIVPSPDWLKKGLPPKHFVRWLRVQEILPNVGTKFLFSHTTEILRTADRRKEYGGSGILGEGYLCRGFLADKWLLNGLALASANPPLLIDCFGLTQQENIGRYTFKIFEGIGWRSLFFDDRIPCTPDGLPLFSCSSDPSETCVMIMQKAFAKYLGSYGHLALCGERLDSAFMALRFFTGAHIIRYFIDDYDWCTIATDCMKEDALRMIDKFLLEGSIVSFAVAEVQFTNRHTLRKDPADRLPHGVVFPVVGTEYRDNYRYLILRDPWGLMTEECTVSTDPNLGYCRTFRVKVENIPKRFDNMIVARFPDYIRAGLMRRKLPTWHTEYVNQITRGPSDPAVFVLDVIDHAVPEKVVAKSKIPSLASLKDAEDLSRKGHSTTSKPTKKDSTTAADDDAGKNTAKSKEFTCTNDDFVNICLTLSSSCEWIHAGATSAGAKSRLVIVPSRKTRLLYKIRDKLKVEIERDIAEKARRRKEEEEKLLALASVARTEEEELAFQAAAAAEAAYAASATSYAEIVETTANDDIIPAGDIAAEPPLNNPATELAGEPTSDQQKKGSDPQTRARYDFVFGEEGCWMSRELKLLPGRYYIFADVSFNEAYDVFMQKVLPKDLKDLAWYEARNLKDHTLHLQMSSQGRFVVVNRDAASVPQHNVDLSRVDVREQCWPFIHERQCDAGSKGLYEVLTRYKREGMLIATQIGEVRHKIKEIRQEIGSYDSSSLELSTPTQ